MAAGIGATAPSNIGNQQYTTGFIPWQHKGAYARAVSATTGNLINPARCYLINDTNSNPVNYHWDVNQSLALANCSNSGRNMLSAWCEGTFIMYKHSQPNVMAFRQANGNFNEPGTGAPINAVSAYAVSNELILPQIASRSAGYIITDMSGRTVQNGASLPNARLDIGGLPIGHYVLQTQAAGNGARLQLKFSKQN